MEPRSPPNDHYQKSIDFLCIWEPSGTRPGRTWVILGSFWDPFWHQNSLKMTSEIDVEINVGKGSTNNAKMRPKVCQKLCRMFWKSVLFHNLQNLDFSYKTAVKTWFLRYWSTQNPWTIIKKTSQNPSSRKVCKITSELLKLEQKWEPKATQNQWKIN